MIRPWTTADIPAIQRVLLETWRDAYGSFIPGGDLEAYLHQHYHLDALRALMSEPNVRGFVAEIDREIVGIARTTYDRAQNRFFLTSLYVLPQHQGKGIGMELLRRAEEVASRYGVDALWLGVMEQNNRTVQWYQRIGFTFVERAPFVMGTTVVNHLIGYRPLKDPPPNRAGTL